MDKIYTYLLLAVASAVLFGTVKHFADDPAANAESAVHSKSIQAHDLALSGIDYALLKLRDNPAWESAEESAQLEIPGVRVQAAPTPAERSDLPGVQAENARFVTSSASVESAHSSVQAIIECPTTPELPPALRYALFAGGDLDVRQQLLVRDEDNQLRNANVHANQQMIVGSRSLVQGFGTYSGMLRMRGDAANKVFSPNYADGGKPLYRHPEISVPQINPHDWERIATRTYASSTILAGDLDIGSMYEPGVWLIKGHLDLRDGIKGSGVLLVTGDLRLYGKKAKSLLNESLENLVIVVGGNVFAEDAKLGGSIICGGSFYGSGHVIIIGSLVAQGNVKSEGTLDLYYRPLPDRLASLLWTPQLQLPRIVRFYDAVPPAQSTALAAADAL
ncbi:MAG: hypothetical protein IH600_08215 [Bacteroidetes bacterium]|nr:hypothetical protein [Bacteroidota bacterium]